MDRARRPATVLFRCKLSASERDDRPSFQEPWPPSSLSGDVHTVILLSLVLTRGGRPSLGSRVALSPAQLDFTSIRSFLMFARSFVSKLFGGRSRRTVTPARNRARSRLAVEALEDRRLMSHSGIPHHTPM